MHSLIVTPLQVLLIAALALPARSHGADAPVDPAELYHDYCSVCHGDRGDGRSRARQGLIPPPRDFTEPGLEREIPRARMITSVLEGRPGTAMVGWKSRLSPQQAAAIVDYIRDNFMRTAAAPAAAHASAARAAAEPAPRPIRIPPGSVKRGMALYMANCSTCHGVEGKGNGPRAYFIFPRPRDFTSAPARAKLTDPVTLFHAVKDGVQGKEMPAWGKVFTHQQIADVSAFVAKSFLQPDARTP